MTFTIDSAAVLDSFDRDYTRDDAEHDLAVVLEWQAETSPSNRWRRAFLAELDSLAVTA